MAMNTLHTIAAAALCVAAFAGHATASTIQTIGSGSAVTTANRIATFNILNQAHNGYGVSDYVENQLFIGVDGDNWVGDGFPVFDPFNGAPGSDGAFQYPEFGSNGWVTIHTTDNKKIYALEFIYGNGWTTGNPNDPWGIPNGVLEWKTWKAGSLVSSGSVGDQWWLDLGTVVGLWDPTGVDEIWLRCTSSGSGDPNLQALALDNVRVQLNPGPGGCPNSTNDCCHESADFSPGCSDSTCCMTVCGADPFCCDTAWDATCASEAQAACTCQVPCTGDINNDHAVNGSDLAILLGAWGTSGPADLNGSGQVNGADLAILLGAWGPCP